MYCIFCIALRDLLICCHINISRYFVPAQDKSLFHINFTLIACEDDIPILNLYSLAFLNFMLSSTNQIFKIMLFIYFLLVFSFFHSHFFTFNIFLIRIITHIVAQPEAFSTTPRAEANPWHVAAGGGGGLLGMLFGKH